MERIKKLGKYRNIILVLMDIFCIALAYYLGVVIITDTVFKIDPYYVKRLSQTILVSVIVYQAVFHITKRYNNIIRYENGRDYLMYFIACMVSSIIIAIVRKVFHIFMLERTKLILLSGIIISLMMISYRVIIRYILVNDIVNKERRVKKEDKKNLLIIGAGNAANEIIKTIHTRMAETYNIIGIIDDNRKRLNYNVSGVKIIGNRNDIVKICKDNKVDLDRKSVV